MTFHLTDEQLDAAAAGELEEASLAYAVSHVRECSDCRDELRERRLLVLRMRLAHVESQPAKAETLGPPVRATREPSRVPRWGLRVAASFLIVAAGLSLAKAANQFLRIRTTETTAATSPDSATMLARQDSTPRFPGRPVQAPQARVATQPTTPPSARGAVASHPVLLTAGGSPLRVDVPAAARRDTNEWLAAHLVAVRRAAAAARKEEVELVVASCAGAAADSMARALERLADRRPDSLPVVVVPARSAETQRGSTLRVTVEGGDCARVRPGVARDSVPPR